MKKKKRKEGGEKSELGYMEADIGPCFMEVSRYLDSVETFPASLPRNSSACPSEGIGNVHPQR